MIKQEQQAIALKSTDASKQNNNSVAATALENQQATIGILLTNIGTPSAPDVKSVRRYLKEFLSDPRVIQLPQILWQPILRGFILRTRPKQSAKNYQKIWTPEGSPLMTISQAQTKALAHYLNTKDNQTSIDFKGPAKQKFIVALGMRYGSPSIKDGLLTLRKANCQRLVVFPLFPQYSATTMASCFDAVTQSLQKCPHIPELRFINHYADNQYYIDALAKSIERHWQQSGRGQHILFSFHGIPEDYVNQGDPYGDHCHLTANLLAKHLGLATGDWSLSFQSRLGPKKWLQPYSDKVITGLPAKGITHLDVVCPGFASDCLETLEEISMQNREFFLRAGGKQFNYIPALNASDEHIEALAKIVLVNVQGWMANG